MLTQKFLSHSLLAIAALSAGSAFAAADATPTGANRFGRASTEAQATRVIDAKTTKTLDVRCGETVTFVNGDKKFSWRFDALRHSFVPLDKIAPADFGATTPTVYVRRNDSERGG